jgi:hypothetical protein
MVEDDMDFEWKKEFNKTWFHPLIDHIHIVVHDCDVINLVNTDNKRYVTIWKHLRIS